MSHANTEALRAVLEDAWERRADLTPEMIARDVRPAVDAAITAHHSSMQGKVFPAGEGIVKGDVEETIRSVSRLARDGMRETDIEVLHIMID